MHFAYQDILYWLDIEYVTNVVLPKMNKQAKYWANKQVIHDQAPIFKMNGVKKTLKSITPAIEEIK